MALSDPLRRLHAVHPRHSNIHDLSHRKRHTHDSSPPFSAVDQQFSVGIHGLNPPADIADSDSQLLALTVPQLFPDFCKPLQRNPGSGVGYGNKDSFPPYPGPDMEPSAFRLYRKAVDNGVLNQRL